MTSSSTPPGPLGVGVIGLGFMGRTHVIAYQAAAAAGLPCELIAVCDPDADRRAGLAAAGGNLGPQGPQRLFDPARVNGYADPAEILRDPRVGLVSICTYTETHVDLALRALAAGKHVLVEKPVALHSAEVRRLAEAARSASTLCMPAMCMRFWPGWDWLRARIQDQKYGRVRSATFQRLGSGPTWAHDFYRDPARSGGAFIDLHIHDADFIYWCFGKPRAVSTVGTHQHLTTLYHFGEPPSTSPTTGQASAMPEIRFPSHIAAEGAWDLAPGAGFRMRFLVNFERASAEFHLTRPEPLVVHDGQRSEAVKLEPITGYEGEIRHLVTTIASGSRDIHATMDEALAVSEMLEAEERSMMTSRAVEL